MHIQCDRERAVAGAADWLERVMAVNAMHSLPLLLFSWDRQRSATWSSRQAQVCKALCSFCVMCKGLRRKLVVGVERRQICGVHEKRQILASLENHTSTLVLMRDYGYLSCNTALEKLM